MGLWCPKLPLDFRHQSHLVESIVPMALQQGLQLWHQNGFLPLLAFEHPRWIGCLIEMQNEKKLLQFGWMWNNKGKTPNLQIAWKKKSWKNLSISCIKTDRLGANVIFFFTWLHQLWPEGIYPYFACPPHVCPALRIIGPSHGGVWTSIAGGPQNSYFWGVRSLRVNN